MRKAMAYITSTFLFAFGLSIQIAQAQTQAPNSGATNQDQAGTARFRFASPFTQPQLSRQGGFSLMSAKSYPSTRASIFTIGSMAASALPNQPVFGTGTVGRLSRWTTFTNGQSIIGDSTIFEDNNARVGIGTETPTSKLTVMGLIESTGAGGIKFPDGTVQSTAAIASIFHDASLTGNGTAALPLGIAAGGVNTIHLNNSSIIAPKIANGTVVRSLNGLFDNISILPGSNIAVTPGGGTLTIAATGLLGSVNHGATLTGNGTSASPLNVANGAIGALQLATSAVTASKIASGQVVKSFNGLFDNVTLAAGSNISITPLGNTLTIASTASGPGSVVHDATLTGNGTAGSPLGIKSPLTLTASIGPVIRATSSGVASTGVEGNGGPSGPGVDAFGGDSNSSFGGPGVNAIGGSSDSGFGGIGLVAHGGVSNSNFGGTGVFAIGGNSDNSSGGDGLVVFSGNYFSGTPGKAAVFNGAVQVNDTFNVTGTKNFKIDHPLDPENKYLYHAAIESSEVLNIYSGNIKLDANGEATVKLPEWFEALNKDIRYSLTSIGAPGQGLYIAAEVSNNQFQISGGVSGAKVSWQVTGIRSDAAMRKHRFTVEEDKPEGERGYYLSPEALDQPQERNVAWARNPELMQKARQQRIETERTRKQQTQIDR